MMCRFPVYSADPKIKAQGIRQRWDPVARRLVDCPAPNPPPPISPISTWHPVLGTTFPSFGSFVATDGNGTCVSIGSTLLRSVDFGATWQSTACPSFQVGYCVATDRRGVWVAVAYGGPTILRSVDNGATWGLVLSDGFSYAGRYVATDGAGNWVAVGGISPGGPVILVSNDNGVSWNPTESGIFPPIPGIGVSGHMVATNGHIWVIVGDGGILTSTDTLLWTARSTSMAYGYSVSYSNGVWIAIGDQSGFTSIILKSTDGSTWVATSGSVFTY